MALHNEHIPSTVVRKNLDNTDGDRFKCLACDNFNPSEVSFVPSMMDNLSIIPGHNMYTSAKRYMPILSADLIESDTDFHIHIDLPGVDKNDLSVTFNDGDMTIVAERKEIFESNSVFHMVHKIERNFGKVKRVMRIPPNVNTDDSRATLVEGVLMITLPKLEQASKRQKLLIA